jgi:2-succinyl-6-hydroxy-2,4-cyclohexadiene-1-carboxylate synthase
MRVNDLEFNVEIDGHGPPLLLLHGFTGSTRAWDAVRPELTATRTCIFVDALGHGGSAAPTEPERYSLDWSTRDLAALLDALGHERVDVLGYSMGGRAALHFAVHAAARVSNLILESASPGIEDAAERGRRAEADNALADRIVAVGVPPFVAEWERLPLLQSPPHVTVAARKAQRDQRLQNTARGLANSLRGMGAGQQEPLWQRLSEINQSVQLIVGAHDTRYCQVAQRMLVHLPDARLAIVPEAGHTVHLDQPARFVQLVASALGGPVQPAFATN